CSPTRRAAGGVVGAGLATTVWPGRRAGPTLPARRIIGTFHAVTAATTPSGLCSRTTFRAASSWSTSVGRSSVAEHAGRADNLVERLPQRLALLPSQQPGEVVPPRL